MTRPRLHPGLVEVYTGDGKGKTTAALGLAVRALGRGLTVYLVQFMKGDPEYGELKSLPKLEGFAFRQAGLATFVNREHPSLEDLRLARAGFEHAAEIVRSGAWDIVILDEILVALDYALVEERAVLELLAARPGHVEIVLTGRWASPAVRQAADLVSEVREIRHPWRRGVPARDGVEH